MAKYVVTGGAGFIGSNLTRYILGKGHDVVVVDNFATGRRENLDGIDGAMTLVEADIRDQAAMEQAFAGAGAIFHEAALGSVPRSVEDPVTSHDVNVTGTISVLQAARNVGVRRVVFAASSSAYGDQKQSPKHEQMVPAPISPYASGKLACEYYLQAYAAVYGMETMCLRYFNVFGPRQDPNGAYAAVIPAFCSLILNGKQPVIFGDGEQSRDFCYIDNVCEANWLAAHAPAERCTGQPLNIACQQATTLNEIVELLSQLLDRDIKPVYAPVRAGDVKDSLADVSAARETIGYEPKVFFRDGLTRAIDWYKANL